ncbi:MAG: glycosyltransferase family 4 protein [Crocinitomicaceae bacterium]|nr:glycosyltransferase family 4 protein [Crocinitomicaceae bacterium]
MPKQLRICHLTSVHLDGDIRIFHKMAKTMAQDFEVHLVVPNTTTRQQDGVHIHSFTAETQVRSKRMKHTVNEVLKVGLAIQADIYQLHDPELLRIAPKLQQAGAKVIFDSHEDVPKQIMDKFWIPWVFRKLISLFYKYYERRVTKKLAGIISVTPGICARFEQHHSKVALVRNFPLQAEFPIPDWGLKNSTHFCYIGGLYESRGIREVVLAMEDVDGVLHLAGTFDDPLLQAELESTKGWQKVHFYGQVGREQIQEILQQCTVGIVTLHPTPSYKEAYPIKMFEYLAAGCAVLASDFPLYRTLLHGADCGVFVDPQNEAEISLALSELATQAEKTAKMGQLARSLFEEKYNWEKEARQLREFYLSL